MTCSNYAVKDNKPFCRVYGFIASAKEKDCFEDYALCFSKAKNILEKKFNDLINLEKRRYLCPECDNTILWDIMRENE